MMKQLPGQISMDEILAWGGGGMSMKYRTLKTTMGRKYRIRMTEDEIAERELYRLAVVVLPLISSVLMFLIWVKAV